METDRKQLDRTVRGKPHHERRQPPTPHALPLGIFANGEEREGANIRGREREKGGALGDEGRKGVERDGGEADHATVEGSVGFQKKRVEDESDGGGNSPS